MMVTFSEYIGDTKVSPEVLAIARKLSDSAREQLDALMNPDKYEFEISEDCEHLFFRKKKLE